MNNWTNSNPVSRVTADSADLYREALVAYFPIPRGFHRLNSMSFNLSANRSREEFVIVDESLPNDNVPPPGIINAKFTHRVSSKTSTLWGVKYAGTMTGTYVMPRTYLQNLNLAYYYFFRAVQWRLRITGANARAVALVPNGPSGIRGLILHNFTMEESDAYGEPTARFTFNYTFMTTLANILATSALYTPLPDSDYQKWVASMTSVWYSRGFDGMNMGKGEVVLSLCQPAVPASPSYLNVTTQPPGVRVSGSGDEWSPSKANPANSPPSSTPQAAGPWNYGAWWLPGFGLPGGAAPDAPIFPPPDPEMSWMHFQNEIYLEINDSVVGLKPLPSQPIDPTTLMQTVAAPNTAAGQAAPQPLVGAAGSQDIGLLGNQVLNVIGGQAGGLATKVSGDPAEMSSAMTDLYQNLTEAQVPTPQAEIRAAPTIYVWMRGRALRANYTIDPPVVLSVGGMPVVPSNPPGQNCGFGQSVVGALGGVPIVGARWKFRYLVLGVPSGIGLPSTPLG
ncbi:MAG TPA: hypothetical protein VKA46_33885 [Gemmataceae bacterium]|nr:hypothetical protein [Gemmataceae bacterium]